MEVTGGCLCGAVRYRYSGEFLRQPICHCRDCQRWSGSAFHVGVIVRKSGFTLSGELRTYRATGDSGRWIDRSFCPACGTGLLHVLEVRGPDIVVIKAGTLDDPGVVVPNYEIFSRSRLPWVSIDADTEKPDVV